MPKPEIVDYINLNRGRYTDEAIRSRLEQAGFGPDEIDEGFRATTIRPTPSGWGETLRRGQFWLAYVAGIGGVIGALWLTAVAFGDQLFVVAVVALGGLAVATQLGGLDRVVRRGFGAALVTLIAVPVVAIAGLYAYCLIAGPSFVWLPVPWV